MTLLAIKIDVILFLVSVPDPSNIEEVSLHRAIIQVQLSLDPLRIKRSYVKRRIPHL